LNPAILNAVYFKNLLLMPSNHPFLNAEAPRSLGKEKFLQAVLDKRIDSKKVQGTSFALKKETFLWHLASGDLNDQNP
jgi:1,6-anhydro-N-acetylmuramate kinase